MPFSTKTEEKFLISENHSNHSRRIRTRQELNRGLALHGFIKKLINAFNGQDEMESVPITHNVLRVETALKEAISMNLTILHSAIENKVILSYF